MLRIVVGAEVPGFADPPRAGANLRFTPPKDGLRGDLYRDLKAKLLGRGEGKDD